MLLIAAVLMSGLVPQRAAGQIAPPVRIETFGAKYNPDSRSFVNTCRAQDCVLGSRVSYILNPPQETPDFEGYKELHSKLMSALKERAAKDGIELITGEPQQLQNETSTTFSSFREARSADGRRMFTKTSLVHTELMTITLISASPDKEAVESNESGFIFGLIEWSKIHLSQDE